VLSLLAGLAIGLIMNFTLLASGSLAFSLPTAAIAPNPEASVNSMDAGIADDTSTPAPAPDLNGNRVLLLRATSVLSALQEENYSNLSTLVHPEKGVTFTPYSTVDADANLNFTATEISHVADDPLDYIWGITDGQGAPIELTMADYFSVYVFNVDYTHAPVIGVDKVIGSGNSLENVTEAYPGGRFVEFHFPGLLPGNEGFDWCSLKLVFEQYNGDYKLVGMIHSQWTI